VIRHHFKSAHQTAYGIDLCHAGQCAQDRPYHPIQNRATLLQGKVFAFHGEHEHITQRRGDWRESAGDIAWQVTLRVIQPFRDLLACPVDVGALTKIDGDVGDRIL